MKEPTVFLRLALASILISINWVVYIWAANNGHLIEAALGYYINPLVMIAIGVALFKEKMSKLQWLAVAIAATGVGILAIDYGRLPWIALTLALSWGTYGGIKKHLNLGALQGLAIETAVMTPFYGAYLIWLGVVGTGQFGLHIGLTTLLVSAGIVTAVPLLLFNGSTTRLPYTIIGLLQYITPTIQFSIGVWVNHEAMPTARWVGFIIIWIALIALAIDLIKSSRPIDKNIA